MLSLFYYFFFSCIITQNQEYDNERSSEENIKDKLKILPFCLPLLWFIILLHFIFNVYYFLTYRSRKLCGPPSFSFPFWGWLIFSFLSIRNGSREKNMNMSTCWSILCSNHLRWMTQAPLGEGFKLKQALKRVLKSCSTEVFVSLIN